MLRSEPIQDGYPHTRRAWFLVVVLSLGVLLSYTDRLIIKQIEAQECAEEFHP